MYCILIITSKNFLKTSTIILEIDNIAWSLQLYLGYMYFTFSRKKRKWINLFFYVIDFVPDINNSRYIECN